jgi:sulfide dehydrogenase [flavocytochrome c] flavoprotein chain
VGVMRRRTFLHRGASFAVGVAAAWRGRALAPSAAAPRVVIVGAGFAGGCCALELRRLNPAIHVTLLDADSPYVSCPMSNEVLVGLRSLESLTLPRAGLARSGVHFVHDQVTDIDARGRRVHLRSGSAIGYDRLVVAPGIRFLYGSPEGYDERAPLRMPHAWRAGPQTELLSAQLRAMPDGGTVAISVPSGLMRCPPGPYERASLIADWLARHRPRSKVLIFDANNHFPRQDVFTAAWQEMYPGLIEWIAPADGGAITRVDAKSCTLYSSGGTHRVAVANVIPPQAPGTLAADSGLASGHGWCPIKATTFESLLLEGVHVIGDACIAGAMPKSASAARSQARQCAAALSAAFDGRAVPAAAFDSVCYSMLSAGSALAIHGTFTVGDGEIRQDTLPAAPGKETPSAERAREATAWYERMRSQCFGL